MQRVRRKLIPTSNCNFNHCPSCRFLTHIVHHMSPDRRNMTEQQDNVVGALYVQGAPQSHWDSALVQRFFSVLGDESSGADFSGLFFSLNQRYMYSSVRSFIEFKLIVHRLSFMLNRRFLCCLASPRVLA